VGTNRFAMRILSNSGLLPVVERVRGRAAATAVEEGKQSQRDALRYWSRAQIQGNEVHSLASLRTGASLGRASCRE
jgi:hypothetical protein